jgi:hypothetical protein
VIAKIASSVIRFRVLVLFLSLILIVLSVLGFKHVYFDSNTDIWFLQDDPVLLEYNKLKKTFGSDDYLVVGIQASKAVPDVLNADTILAIRKITDFLEEHPAINKVRSMVKYEYMFYQDDMLHVETAIPSSRDYQFPASKWDQIRTILAGEHIAHNLLFTKDLQHTLISARVIEQDKYTGAGEAKTDVSADFRAFLEREGLAQHANYQIYLSGSATISESFFHFSMVDQSISYPIMMTFILIFLFLTFRTWLGTLLPILVLTASCMVTIGMIGYLGWSMNMLNVTLPTMLTVVVVAETIHVLIAFYRFRHQGLDPKESAVETIRYCLEPCFYTSLTTMLGYLALSTGSIALVVTFGIEMAFGVLMAFFFSLFTLPALLSYTSAKGKTATKLVADGPVARFVNQLPDRIYPRRKQILVITALSLLPLGYLCSQVKVDTNFVRFFQEDAAVRQGLDYFDQTYKGSLSLEFSLDAKQENGVKDPAYLARALEFQHYLSTLEGNGKVNSPVNYLMKINQVMNNNDASFFKLPDSREMVGQFLLLYSNAGPDEDLADMISFNGQEMRISVFFAVAPSVVTKQRIAAIEQHIAQHFADLNIKVTGRAVLFNNVDNYTLSGLANSFMFSLITILLCLFLVLRSVKYGFVAMIPNLMPIIIVGALMALLDIYLDFATMIVAATTLGIAVDDTIHVMDRFRRAKATGLANREAITKATRESGVALVSTTIILFIGFAMLLLSSFVPNIYMGLLGAMTIVLAIVCDLLILPAVLMCLDEKESVVETLPQTESA